MNDELVAQHLVARHLIAAYFIAANLVAAGLAIILAGHMRLALDVEASITRGKAVVKMARTRGSRTAEHIAKNKARRAERRSICLHVNGVLRWVAPYGFGWIGAGAIDEDKCFAPTTHDDTRRRTTKRSDAR